MKLLVDTSGAVTGMYSDRLLSLAKRLSSIDDVSIKRASNVEWNGKEWEATDARNGEVIAREPTREMALATEHRVIESRLQNYV